MKNYPKIKFEVAPIKEFLPSINYFLKPTENSDWRNKVLYKHPPLRDKLKNIKNEIERKQIIREYFQDFQSMHKPNFINSKEKFQKEWDKINDKLMTELSNVLEIEWPKRDKEIIAFVGPNPVCPRYIKQRAFDIYYNFSLDMMKNVSTHEVLHFLYFEKFKKIFPRISEKKFDGPYIEWELSEIVPKAILSDKRIQKIIPHKPSVYDSYKKIIINKRPLLKYIDKFYNSGKSFEDFIKESYDFVKKHKKIITKK